MLMGMKITFITITRMIKVRLGTIQVFSHQTYHYLTHHCLTQPSSIHWLSSSIFPCSFISLPFVCPFIPITPVMTRGQGGSKEIGQQIFSSKNCLKWSNHLFDTIKVNIQGSISRTCIEQFVLVFLVLQSEMSIVVRQYSFLILDKTIPDIDKFLL